MQLLDNLLQKAAAYSAFLRGRMQEAVALKTDVGKPGQDDRDPRQPALVTGAVMRKYQVEGVLWMASLYENGLNGILADEMGLGKTLQTIAFLAHLYEMKVYGPFLVVAPLSTIQNWSREFTRFAPSVPTVVYHGSKDDRKEMREKMIEKKGQEWPVVITSFEVAMNDAKILARLPRGGSWKYLVVDEGHRLKNKDCRLLRELKALPTDNRLLLSGTPLQVDDTLFLFTHGILFFCLAEQLDRTVVSAQLHLAANFYRFVYISELVRFRGGLECRGRRIGANHCGGTSKQNHQQIAHNS